jgi:predicted DsbA family dithiol-disulfide isomerase
MTEHTVEIHVDPACPWCWLTALWLFEAERIRPLTVFTKVFSLAEVNRGDDDKRDSHNAGERALRVLVAARRRGGEQAIRDVYTGIGEAYHERDEPLGDSATLQAAVVAAGLDRSFVDAALADESTLTELLSEHGLAVERGAFGVPTLTVDGGAPFFGPIIDTRITGEDAGRLWDVVAPVLAHPRVFELKRTRTTKADVARYRLRAAATG